MTAYKVGTRFSNNEMPLTVTETRITGPVTEQLATDSTGRWYLLTAYNWNTYTTVVASYKSEAAARRTFQAQAVAA